MMSSIKPSVGFYSSSLRKKEGSRIFSNKRIFDWNELKNNSKINLEMVDEAYDVCHRLSGKHREVCYLVYGLDEKNVEAYYSSVKHMEKAYHTSGKKEGFRFRLGEWEIQCLHRPTDF